MESDHQQPLNNDSTDVVKVILNLNREVENHEPQWDELEKLEVMDFNKFPLAMKSCISHYKLDLKQAAAFNVICSTFMLAHLEDPSIKKTLEVSELDKAKQVLLDKGGLGRLVMNLTGSGGSGKSFVLDATKSFCIAFVVFLLCVTRREEGRDFIPPPYALLLSFKENGRFSLSSWRWPWRPRQER